MAESTPGLTQNLTAFGAALARHLGTRLELFSLESREAGAQWAAMALLLGEFLQGGWLSNFFKSMVDLIAAVPSVELLSMTRISKWSRGKCCCARPASVCRRKGARL